MMYRNQGKRVFDLLVAGTAIVILLPVYVLTAIGIILDDGRPVLFTQSRVGTSSRLFRLYKFRSMKTNVGEVPSADISDDAVTRVGKIIRRVNIDELPQLLNVIRGEMSIVGPRPALTSQTTLLGLRSSSGVDGLRPGLTGLAQINAYDGMTEEDKAHLDAQYVNRVSFVRDCFIVLRTVVYLFRRPPVY